MSLTPPPGSSSALPIFSLALGAGSGTQTTSVLGWPSLLSSTLTKPVNPAVVDQGHPLEIAGLPGFGSVPPKLIKRIVAREYVDIWELLPETWHVESAEGACCHSKRPRRSLITDINVWTECYATLAAILSTAYPDKAPQFFAYLRTITKASRTFESSAWATYDMAYRRQAANKGSLDWGIVDAALYSEAFAGRAKAIPRCRYCLADTHTSLDCPHAPPETPDSRPPRGAQPARQAGRSTPSASVVELCRLYNSPGGSRCRFSQCRFAHLCSRCRRPHPAAECGANGGENPKRQRTQSPPTSRPLPPAPS